MSEASRLSESLASLATAEDIATQLSIILVTDSCESVGRVLRCYRTQGDPARLEIVVVGLNGIELSAPMFMGMGFPHVKTIQSVGSDRGVAEFMALQAATAPVVVFAQAESYPRPGFVDAILETQHSHQWAVIGPSIARANPGNTLSWAALWILYGPWVDVQSRGLTKSVPGHNSAYRRSALLSLGRDLEALDAGAQLQVELSARGYQCFLEPDACIEIVMPSRLADFVSRLFRHGRQFAGQRRTHWSAVRRLGYGVASPLIPIVRLTRIFELLIRRGHTRAALSGLPALVLGLVASAAGELVGYILGPYSEKLASGEDTAPDLRRTLEGTMRSSRNAEPG